MFEAPVTSKITPAKTTKLNSSYLECLTNKLEQDKKRLPNALLGYSLNHFYQLAQLIDGLQPALYLIGAETNIGKTAFLCNLFLDLIESNKHITAFYFSLDDTKDTITNRLLALLTRLTINSVQRPSSLSSENQQLLINSGYNILKKYVIDGRLDIKDSNDIADITVLEELIDGFFLEHPDQPLVLFIDGLYNLSLNNTLTTNLREENIIRANKLKELVDKYKIPVLATAEVRKKSSKASELKQSFDAAPTHHDLMESSKFAYNAQVIWMLHPHNWNQFKNSPEPIIELIFEKNKLSSFKGTQQLVFKRELSLFKEKIITEKTECCGF